MGISALPSADYKTLSDQIAQVLRNAILTGDLRGGERLIESAVAERMGVSRAPVREAILALKGQGLVSAVPRKGAFVTRWSRTDVEELFTLRVALEGLAVRLAAGRITPQEVQRMLALIEHMREGAGVLTPGESIELDLQFHELLWAASKHSRLRRALGDTRAQMAYFISKSRSWIPKDPAPESVVCTEHQDILAAVRNGDADLAGQCMRKHIESGARHVLEALEKEEGGQPTKGHYSTGTRKQAKEGTHGIQQG